MKIAVLGAGNGAHAIAGHMALKGHEVRMWENPSFAANLDHIIKNDKCIDLEGEINGRAKLAIASTDPKDVICGADIIYCVMPSFGQESAFDFVSPFIEPGQKIVVMPGNFGSISLYMKLKKRGIADKVLIGESDTIPYATRLQEDKSSLVFGIKESMWISAIPGNRTRELVEAIGDVFPIGLNPLSDVVSVALANTNMILHCATMIMNTGRIEGGSRFRFYNEGMTESVCRVMEKMDTERIAVGKAWGYDLISEYEDAISNYNLDKSKYSSLHEIFIHHPVYGNHGADSPTSMTFRYLSEDVPFLLLPLSEMAMLVNIPVPTVDSVIQLAQVINNTDYRKNGRGMEALGLKGFSYKEIKKIVSGE
ncbi:MAG: NAD/NADP octopine/nopaline dehydrogenase family protein [Acidaminococcaceae bacterium]|nr:NAD/NADP octopine/nopaline dehydrogenase family protein [Acidaminococcaceae bacterium]